ncbi:MAG TPA: DUF6786 family protein [Puia sp.]|nr:DUF6786 family protein [Puia sp.]
MKKRFLGSTMAVVMLAAACNNNQSAQQQTDTTKTAPAGSFAFDLAFLQQHDSVIVLQSDGGKAQVIVSPRYQAKVFTSTAEGGQGKSFGWIHYKAFTGPVDAHMNGYGGENRIWLGPEGGKYSLFFPKGAAMEFANWKTPAAFDTEAWRVTKQDPGSVSLQKDMQLVNYAGTPLSLSVTRDIAILNRSAIDSMLGSQDTALKVVGYRTNNTLTNTGAKEWTEATGMPCIWMLDMFNPSPATVIVVPHKPLVKKEDKVATTDYFGEIASDRIKIGDSTLFFKADGKSRGKLGIHPAYAMPRAGSYDAQNKVLTVTMFDIDPSGKYLNQEWKTTKPAFSGDAVNAYNDGPLADGSQMGPFYEIESVSPAAFLKPGQSLQHQHMVFHFTGDEAALDKVSRAWLGVSLDTIKKVF